MFLIDLSQADMKRRLGDALGIYVEAMGYPRGTEDQRASMWLDHVHRPGWQAVAAVEAPPGFEQNPDPEAGRDPGPDPTLRADPDRVDSDRAVLAHSPLVGIAYGYAGAPDQWWQQQVVQGLAQSGADTARIAALTGDYFELTELHIRPGAQGCGLGEALTRRLLVGRSEPQVLLSTPEISGEANRAWRLYRRLGFADVIRNYYFAGDPRAFAVLGRPLPL
jgi:ribosomal protein S18 acetylase RimI-like enzyme